MSTDPFPIRRIDIDADTTVWLPAGPPPTSDAPARAWRVRPAGVAVGAGLASAALLRLGATADGLLAAVVGVALGAKVLAALMVGSLACVPVALVMLVRGARGRSATLPYGPFLTFGAA